MERNWTTVGREYVPEEKRQAAADMFEMFGDLLRLSPKSKIMKRQKVTLTNDFHNSEVNLRIEHGQPLSPNQIRRARRVLCGLTGCLCGGALGERGHQDVDVDQLDENNIVILDPGYQD